MFSGVSTFAPGVDEPMAFILWASAIIMAGITAFMVWCMVRFSRKRNPKPTHIHGSVKLEVLWTVIPTILALYMFYIAFGGFDMMTTRPDNAMVVKVTGLKWRWVFEYENGKKSDRMVVPRDQPVVVELSSADVIHSFYVPAFRIKKDAVPGKNNWTWFEAQVNGDYNLFCAEYCGNDHSYMLSTVSVVDPGEFTQWVNTVEAVKSGRDLLASKGCVACHSLDGSPLVGPTFKGLFGKLETVLSDGVERQVTVDEAYIRKSIFDPAADLVKGFSNQMPSQAGLISDEEVDVLIETIKELRE